MNSICKALSMESLRYDPKLTVKNIDAYIDSSDRLDRILYSEISNYIYSLEMEQRGIFATNVEKLLLYSLDEKNHVGADTKKIEKLNWTCLIIAIVVIGSWLFSIKELQEFISNLLPWGK